MGKFSLFVRGGEALFTVHCYPLFIVQERYCPFSSYQVTYCPLPNGQVGYCPLPSAFVRYSVPFSAQKRYFPLQRPGEALSTVQRLDEA
jgi:hypothetical protein